jgi:hypothetical protein
MKAKIKASETRFPSLTRAVLRRVDLESLEDVCNHGASGGFSGFTYYADTLAFFKAHKADILALAQSQAEDFGQGMLEMIAGFNCLKGDNLNPDAVAQAIYTGKGDNAVNVRNALAWYALEEVARELNPNL